MAKAGFQHRPRLLAGSRCYTQRMSLFSFGKKKGYALALIDIGSASVGGAYAYYEENQEPIIYYTARVDVEPKKDETVTESMLRSLAFLERLLIEEGAPQLRRETGSGSVEKIMVSVAAPWQETTVATTHIEKEQPFTYTRAHLHDAAEALQKDKEGRRSTGFEVLSIALNGYETPSPFGKRARRADMVLAASTLDREASEQIERSLRHAFHTHTLEFVAFAPVAGKAFARLYPHHKDFIVIDVSGSGTDIAFVRHGHLSETCSIPHGTHDLFREAIAAGKRAHVGNPDFIDRDPEFTEDVKRVETEWIEDIKKTCSSLSASQALPRTVFLLAEPKDLPYLKRSLEESSLRSLWLTNEPLQVVAVEPSHLAHHVKTRGLGDGDVFLALLALSASPKKR